MGFSEKAVDLRVRRVPDLNYCSVGPVLRSALGMRSPWWRGASQSIAATDGSSEAQRAINSSVNDGLRLLALSTGQELPCSDKEMFRTCCFLTQCLRQPPE